MAKRNIYVNADGYELKTGNIYNDRASKLLGENMGPNRHYMRVGRFGVVANGLDLFAAEIYDDGDVNSGMEPSSPFWDSRRNDRLRQLALVQQSLQLRHPLFSKIMAEIKAERQFWG